MSDESVERRGGEALALAETLQSFDAYPKIAALIDVARALADYGMVRREVYGSIAPQN
jgi:hypothetical protein